jgi:hypothetical protein
MRKCPRHAVSRPYKPTELTRSVTWTHLHPSGRSGPPCHAWSIAPPQLLPGRLRALLHTHVQNRIESVHTTRGGRIAEIHHNYTCSDVHMHLQDHAPYIWVTLAWKFFPPRPFYFSLSLGPHNACIWYAHNVKKNLVFIYWEKIKVVWWVAGFLDKW